MRVLITGESGFIAQNLARAFSNSNHEVVTIDDPNVSRLSKTGEVCVYRNSAESWQWHLENLNVDLVIHNAAVVGTDVVALSPNESSLTNLTGTYNIVRACKKSKVPVCYMGTTVIYDTARYQDDLIEEDSALNPTTFYGVQKLAAERVVTTHSDDWMVIRPLFAFGGVGDMNSLIAKTIFAYKENRDNIDMFLDPLKVKDYLHVKDYCDAVVLGCENSSCWGNDFNVSAETPYVVGDIVKMVEKEMRVNLDRVVRWHPETDYLGNHRLTSSKFRNVTGWEPKITLSEGIAMSVNDILEDSTGFNPLIHLDEAKNKNIELTDFFNSNI